MTPSGDPHQPDRPDGPDGVVRPPRRSAGDGAMDRRGRAWAAAVRRSGGRSRTRPTAVFDEGLQHERTALAWERTAISSMVAGVLMARYAATSVHYSLAAVGLAQVVVGAALLIWSGQHYDDLHGPLRAGESPAHPTAARRVGLATVWFSGAALALAVAIALE